MLSFLQMVQIVSRKKIFALIIRAAILNKRAASWENQQFAYAKTKAQISFAVTAKLISAFVFATRIVQPLYFLNTKFYSSSCFL